MERSSAIYTLVEDQTVYETEIDSQYKEHLQDNTDTVENVEDECIPSLNRNLNDSIHDFSAIMSEKGRSSMKP